MWIKEVTYYILTHAEADMSDPFLRRGTFKADVVFRGAHYGNVELPGFKEDFQLIAKEDEKHYLERTLAKGQNKHSRFVVAILHARVQYVRKFPVNYSKILAHY